MNNYAAPIDGVALPWIEVVSIVLALLFPVSLYATAGGIKNRIRLLAAAIAGLATTLMLGVIRRDSLKGILVIYSDVMISVIIGGIIISLAIRGADSSSPIDTDKWRRFGYKVSGVLAVIIGVLLFLEYGPLL